MNNELELSDLQPDTGVGQIAGKEPLRRALFAAHSLAEEVATLLDQAASAYVRGETRGAASLLVEANRVELREFALDCMGPKAAKLKRETKRDAAYPSKKSGLRMPSPEQQRAILERDGYRCRFCETRVVGLGVRSLLSRAFPDEVPWPRADIDKHGAFLALNATVDHVLPHARGGSNDASNLVTACWPCNFTREDLLLKELGIADPFEFPVLQDSWDGLSRLLIRPPPMMPKVPVMPKVRSAPRLREAVEPDKWLELQPLLQSVASVSGVSVRQRSNILIDLRVADVAIVPIAIGPDGVVELPWSIGGYKAEFHQFALAMASAIPGAEPYETPKMWRVRVPGRGLSIFDLMAAEKQLVSALSDLSVALGRVGPSYGN